jgi:hypothetical protein
VEIGENSRGIVDGRAQDMVAQSGRFIMLCKFWSSTAGGEF